MNILSYLDPATAQALACPSWCTEPAGHHDETRLGIYRTHRREFTAVAHTDDPDGSTFTVTVAVFQHTYFDREDGTTTVEPPAIRVGDTDDDGLPAADARAVAALVVQAADLLGGAL